MGSNKRRGTSSSPAHRPHILPVGVQHRRVRVPNPNCYHAPRSSHRHGHASKKRGRKEKIIKRRWRRRRRVLRFWDACRRVCTQAIPQYRTQQHQRPILRRHAPSYLASTTYATAKTWPPALTPRRQNYATARDAPPRPSAPPASPAADISSSSSRCAEGCVRAPLAPPHRLSLPTRAKDRRCRRVHVSASTLHGDAYRRTAPPPPETSLPSSKCGWVQYWPARPTASVSPLPTILRRQIAPTHPSASPFMRIA
ncbi:hypothetical protein B0H16DRAFT_528979 [Mycena metata]|uniref:Uncharacterized protein n=1 Tax=Mycena metata TaxID=1033252 RepID=A0AAD7NI82_9AGAR|nr:hypothetical protein B0H16DRAFT_528979 [Mycena metata]